VRPRPLHAGSKRRYPPGSAVIRGGGSLRSALTELGYQAAWTPVSDQQTSTLRAYTREHGRAPNVTTWRREHRTPGASVIIRRQAAGAPR